MYNIGDRVVYPMHGAGVIETIELKKILDEEREYYILSIPFGDMKVMLPVDNCDAIGVRPIVDHESIEAVMNALGEEQTTMNENWNKRYRDNLIRLKSGDIMQVADVVRNLMISDKKKGLSTGERKMLIDARRILSSEMMLVEDISSEEAERRISQAVFSEK